MKRMFWITVIAVLSVTSVYAESPVSDRGLVVPRVRFSGDDFASRATVIFTETLKDMHGKLEYGDNPAFGAGFFIPRRIRSVNRTITNKCGRAIVAGV